MKLKHLSQRNFFVRQAKSLPFGISRYNVSLGLGFIWFFILFLIFSVIQCGQMPREKLLNGQFGNVKVGELSLLAPNNNTRINKTDTGSVITTFVWEGVSGVSAYKLEIASDAAFSEPVSGSPFLINSQNGLAPKTSFQWSPPDAYSYYWRVSTGGKVSASRVFHVIKDVVYVHCPQGVSCNNNGRYGNKSFPFRSIRTGISKAIAMGFNEVRVAARGGTDSYDEKIILMNAISLKGGYSHVDWSRNIANNETIISHASDERTLSIIDVAASRAWEISGFTIKNNLPSIGAKKNGVYAQNVNHRLTISENKIWVRNGARASAILIQNSDIIVKNNTLISGESFSTGCLNVKDNSAPYIDGNTFLAGNSANVRNNISALRTTFDSTLVLINNRINLRKVSSSARIAVLQSTSLILSNIITYEGSKNNFGLELNASSRNTFFLGNTIACSKPIPIIPSTTTLTILNINGDTASKSFISHNTLCGGGASFTRNVYINSGLNFIDNNILFTPGNGDKILLFERMANADPKSLKKNNLVDLGSSGTFFYYKDFDGDGQCHAGGSSNSGNCATIVDMEADLNAEVSGVASGNVSAGSPNLFVNLKGPDNDVSTFDDNDWSLKSTATGVLNGGFTCPGEMRKEVFSWGNGSDQTDCDKKYPHSNSTYSAGKCESTFLYPSMQIDKTTGKVAGNGLCEDGETCLYNPNMGSYAGHGTLMNAGCNLSTVAGGAFSNVELLKYQSNGY